MLSLKKQVTSSRRIKPDFLPDFCGGKDLEKVEIEKLSTDIADSNSTRTILRSLIRVSSFQTD